MRKLINPKIAPPGGWRYRDPDTKFVFDLGYRSLDELIEHVNVYRNQNKLAPLVNPSLYIQDWLCGHPEIKRYCAMVASGRTVGQYVRGAKAAVKVVTSGEGAFEPQQVAEKRAKICVNCPYNQPVVDKTLLREASDKAIEKVVGKRRTTKDAELFICAVCSCPLRAKVHIAQNIIEESLSPRERRAVSSNFIGRDGESVFCWQLYPIRSE